MVIGTLLAHRDATMNCSVNKTLAVLDNSYFSKFRLHMRLLSAHSRMLPTYIIIGAQKCGTTALHHFLTQHPNVAPSLTKEIHYFDHEFNRGLDWYRAHFSKCQRTEHTGNSVGRPLITGESSPFYMVHPLTPKRVFRILPNVKIIILLRNPIDRAYSHYHHEIRYGAETLSFEQAIERESARLKGEWEILSTRPGYRSFSMEHFSYLTRGVYADQLRSWFEVFPKEQLLILLTEELMQDASRVFLDTLFFLDLPEWTMPQFNKIHIGRYPELKKETRKSLAEYFAPHNERLQDFLGRRPDWK